MKTINKISEIIKLAQNQTIYIRWSRGPEMDKKQGRSYDQVAHQYHNGLSAQNVHADNPSLLAQMLPEYMFLRRKDSKIFCWIFSGMRNGTDSDDAPTIDASTIVPLGKISETLIEMCYAYSQAQRQMTTKYCHNAWKPEHHATNAKITDDLEKTWNAIA